MFSHPPHNDMQDSFLYDVQWTKKIDAVFIDIISFQSELGNFCPGRKNYSTMGSAIDSISRQFGKNFSFSCCQDRETVLFKRYNTFAWMLSNADFMYDPLTKYTNAPAYTWDAFFKVFYALNNAYVI